MATAALVVGTIFTVGAIYSSGEGNQAIAEHNAILGEFRAQDSERRGKELATATRENFDRLKGEQRVGFATQGIDIDVGNAAEIEADTQIIAELEVDAVNNNAALEAWGFRAGAGESILSGELAAQQGALGAAGALFSGAGQAIVASRRPGSRTVVAPVAPVAPAGG